MSAVQPDRRGHVRFPPKRGHVLVPTAPRRAAAAAIGLYTASKPLPLVVQQLSWTAVRLGGSAVLPGRRESWDPPMAPDIAAALLASWAPAAGGSVLAVGVYRRPQAHRSGFVVLVIGRRGNALVRVSGSGHEPSQDRLVSEAAARLRPTRFRVPAVLDSGSVAGWEWTAYEVISRRPHRPVRHAAEALLDEVSELVEHAVPRPASVPKTWRGAHGDLTPWNLRRARRQNWLIDWEDANYAPPGTDAVYFAVTAAAIRARASRPSVVDRYPEARQLVAERIATATVAAHEVQLHARLRELLGPAR